MGRCAPYSARMLEFAEPTYEGREYTADDVETLRSEARRRHQEAVTAFRTLETDYRQLSEEITGQMGDDARWASQLKRLADGPTMGDKVRASLARVGLGARQRPLAQQLEEQLEAVQTRIHGVARLRQSIEEHIAALEEDVRRLNREVVEAALNEENAAQHVLELSRSLDTLESELVAWDVDDRQSAAFRTASSRADELKSSIRIHGSKARAFSHAEQRLAGVVDMNRHFLEMLRHAGENMDQLAAASHQVVDEISGNVQALAQMTLANEMAVDLMQATRDLKKGINTVATLASGTALDLTREIDAFVADTSVYAPATIAKVESDMSEGRRLRQDQVDQAIARALESA
ncbi:MAG: hypothetical protein ACI9WU_001889 [Myxococcota bacterium]|jgi:hypothetical protein